MASNVKTVALCGISHVRNFGCEAIIRSTCAMLRECMPDCRIIYLSRNSEGDKLVLDDLMIETVQLSRNPDSFSRFVNKILLALGIRARISYDRFSVLRHGIDLLVSVGGDIYTVEKELASKKGYRAWNRLVGLEAYAKKRGSKLILYGASVGPFPKENGNEAYFKKHLDRMNLIVCREEDSIKYLKSININSPIMFSPDPAFFLSQRLYARPMSERSGIALNLSPRLIDFGGNINAQKDTIASIVLALYQRFREPIFLVPHVYADNVRDDDFRFMTDIRNRLPDEVQRDVVLHEESSFLQAKGFFSGCRLVISARMHAAINAMSEGTPTILISYSQKAIGMSRYIYGSDDWVLSADTLQTELIPCVERMTSQEETVHDHLVLKMEEILRSNFRKDVCDEIVRIVNE